MNQDNLSDVGFGNGVYVVVGNSGKILTSTDLVTWINRSSGVRNNLYGVAYGDLCFVAVGEGTIIYSTCTSEAASSSLDTTKGYTVEDNTVLPLLELDNRYPIDDESGQNSRKEKGDIQKCHLK